MRATWNESRPGVGNIDRIVFLILIANDVNVSLRRLDLLKGIRAPLGRVRNQERFGISLL